MPRKCFSQLAGLIRTMCEICRMKPHTFCMESPPALPLGARGITLLANPNRWEADDIETKLSLPGGGKDEKEEWSDEEDVYAVEVKAREVVFRLCGTPGCGLAAASEAPAMV